MSMDDIEKLKVRVEKDPNSRLFLPLAEEYRKAGMLDEAISVLLRGLERHPGYTSARVALGKIYLEKKMVEDARREFEKVIAAIPDNLFAHKKLAEIYRDIGEIDRAIAEYKAVLEINPLDEDAKSFIKGVEKPGEENVPGEVIMEIAEEPFTPEIVEELPGEEIKEIPGLSTVELEVGEPIGEATEATVEHFMGEEGYVESPIEEKLEEELSGLPEEVFDLSVEEPIETLPEDMMEVRSPFSEIGESGESISTPETSESLTEAEQRESQEILYEELSPFEGSGFHKEGQLDFSEADALVAGGQYFKALDRYKALLKEYPDNKKVLQRIAELKNLLKLLGKDEETVLKLEAFLEGIRRRRDEFFGRS
ncbi:MAG: tetratricopeptide repeat protein [Thermodesulfovibrionales bacterium]